MNKSWWLVIFLCVVVVAAVPLISLWSLNTIFNLGGRIQLTYMAGNGVD